MSDAPSSPANGRASSGSEVAVISDHAAVLASPVRDLPTIANIHNSSRVHLGPNIYNVSTTVHSNEVIESRFLGLEVVSPERARRLRCCVAVFVCWAVIFAAGLGIFFCYISLREKVRLNLELPCNAYIWNLVKNSTRAERLLCISAVLLVAVCSVLAIYFTVFSKQVVDEPDIAPHEWFITRNMWLAESYTKVPIEKHFEPLRLVIIQHTVSTVCYRFDTCATEMRNMQTYFIHHKDRDIPYNFLVGNDGRIYEGRGWQAEGAHTVPYNRCSVGIGFVGDYRPHEGDIKVTAAQEISTHLLLAEGVRLGYLHPDYLVSGAKDLGDSESPGANLYSVIQQWEHYDHTKRFRNKTCEVINEMPFDKKIN